MKNILITGASGMLGATLVNNLKYKFNVYATSNSKQLDYDIKYMRFNLKSLCFKSLLKWSKPEIIIHCGALTDGLYCATNPDEAFSVNGESMQKIINASDKTVKIIYISTDAVFPSSLSMANEKDQTNPESVYGKSKEMGEKLLLKSKRDYIILRTTIVGKNINSSKNGFVEWIIESVLNKQKVKLFSDVLFNPISIWSFSNEIEFLLKSDKFYNNIFHLSGIDKTTKYDFGVNLINEMNLDVNYITKSKISEFKNRSKRSNDQTMDCSKYINLTNRTLPTLSETIKSIKTNYYV